MTFGLTKRQGDAFAFIKTYVETHDGVSPSFDEIRIGIGIASKGRVAEMVAALEERGLIRRLPHRARSIAIVEARAA